MCRGGCGVECMMCGMCGRQGQGASLSWGTCVGGVCVCVGIIMTFRWTRTA